MQSRSRWRLGPVGTTLERALDSLRVPLIEVIKAWRPAYAAQRSSVEQRYCDLMHHMCQAMVFADVADDDDVAHEHLVEQAYRGYLAACDLIEILHQASLNGWTDAALAATARTAVDVASRPLRRWL